MASTIAELLRDDDFPWRRKALEELNDDPSQREQKLAEMRERLAMYKEKHPTFRPQTDDDFLLAFLRTRKFNVKKAFDAFVNYHGIRVPNPDMLMPRGKGPRDFAHILSKGIATILPARNPLDGSVICFISLKNFDHEVDDVSHVINIVFYFFRIVLRSASFQTLGLRVVIDIAGVSMGFFKTLLQRFYNLRALIIAQGSFPIRIKGIHIMNEYYGMVKYVYKMVWPFMTTKMRQRIHLHGTNYNELHNHISREILLRSVGGSLETIDTSAFLKLLMETHDEAVQENHFGCDY